MRKIVKKFFSDIIGWYASQRGLCREGTNNLIDRIWKDFLTASFSFQYFANALLKDKKRMNDANEKKIAVDLYHTQ